MSRASSHKQGGVALITVLLIVAIATVISVQMMSRQVFDMRRTENILDRDQANAYALAAEAWTRQVLMDARIGRDSRVDHLNQLWAQSIAPPAFEGVQVVIEIEDMQGRLNINNLVNPDTGDANQTQVQRFQRLLQNQGLDTALLPALLDWIDPDQDERLGGAEDDYYTRLDPPYRPANRPMTSQSELRLVRGVDDATYQSLAGFITALPVATPVNVNTASAAVLQTIAEGLSEADAKALIKATPEEGYETVAEFASAAELAGRPMDQAGLSVGSNWFLMRVEVGLGRTRFRAESLIYRGNAGATRTVLRRQGFHDINPSARTQQEP